MQNRSSAAKQKKLPWWHVLRSVLSAFIGVQSQTRAQRDFQQGNFKTYAIIGVVAVILFIVTMLGVVNFIIARG